MGYFLTFIAGALACLGAVLVVIGKADSSFECFAAVVACLVMAKLNSKEPA